MSWLVEQGDCLAALRACPTSVVDALVTDPPAGIGFMGMEWDRDKGGREAWIAWLAERARECLRVLKPGAHGLVWALPRTSHWTATALEDAGFEVRDVVTHLFGTGFPKSLDLGEGRGTGLKPASEHWILVRKPVESTTTANVERWGTGGLNVDACRIGTDVVGWGGGGRGQGSWDADSCGLKAGEARPVLGRWPANVVLSHDDGCGDACTPGCAVRALDEQAGERTGGASRFFYAAKPSPSERDLGCDALPMRTPAELVGREDGAAGRNSPRAGAGRTAGRRNHHPTVKSIALMRWLCRLVTPPGGVVLDPFCGSGSTGCAALLEGLHFAGIEQDPEYVAIARARIGAVEKEGLNP